MTESVLDTIETILESVVNETDDSDVSFKLRTALQLLVVVRERENVAREALENCEMEEELRQRLSELGYLSQ